MAKKGKGGNAHDRAVFNSAVDRSVAEKLSQSQPETTPQPDLPRSSSGRDRLSARIIRLIEQPLFLTAFSILAGIVGLIYFPFLAVVGLCIVVAFHRARVVEGYSWKIKLFSYATIFAVTLAGLYGVSVILKKTAPMITLQDIKALISSENKGFVQIEGEREILPIKAGDYLRINFHYTVRGNRPVKDVQSWGGVLLLDPGQNSPLHVKQVWNDGLRDSYRQFRGSGADLGVDGNGWNTAVSNFRLTPNVIKAIQRGDLRLFEILGVAWSSEDGADHYSARCNWVDWKNFPNYPNVAWHIC